MISPLLSPISGESISVVLFFINFELSYYSDSKIFVLLTSGISEAVIYPFKNRPKKVLVLLIKTFCPQMIDFMINYYVCVTISYRSKFRQQYVLLELQGCSISSTRTVCIYELAWEHCNIDFIRKQILSFIHLIYSEVFRTLLPQKWKLPGFYHQS